MGPSVYARNAAILLVAAAIAVSARAQVFTVGEKTATSDIRTDFTATHVELPAGQLTERGRRDLIRNLEAEQGFAHRVLPVGGILTLQANGNLTPGPAEYKQMIYKKGQAAAAGDRVAITALEFKGDRINVDFNGGPYVKHRFLRHLSVGVGPVETPTNLDEQATGCRISLVFEGVVPDVSAPEVKALLQPLIDFGMKTGEQAYADTLPPPIKSAIESHEVRVGMDRRMVLAALGQPESKIRETTDEGQKYEEWIYGHQPQTVRFVRFVGEQVTLIKVAALGKDMEVRDQNELAGVLPPPPDKTVAVGDVAVDPAKAAPPTLMKPGESAEVPSGNAQRKVQFPDEKKPAPEPESQELIATPSLM